MTAADSTSDRDATMSLGSGVGAAMTGVAAPAWTEAAERPGDRIGPYTLVSPIGEGGFGLVWLAERREPMVQRVALKIVKPGMDSRAIVARFEQERQALAVMDHPNVARVFDGGVTPTGRPYFVMEHVQGDHLTAFCDRNRLTIPERLALFATVCDAVQHAHSKGIIHRDLKPSNILVSMQNDRPLAKVIDFGVAKAITQTLTDKTIESTTGGLIGTPEYMSPEQADLGSVDIDTRTDIYSLGVVLYELLAGLLPFEGSRLRSGGLGGIQKIIRDEEPPRPSTRLTTADAETGRAIAHARQEEREALARELRRELEWIPLKAMRKDRARRYASAEALGADVRRYLESKPLEAAPESRVYLLRKFARRNRGQVAAACAIVLALGAGLATTIWQALRASERAEAAEKAEVKARAAAAEEKKRADELELVSSFQASMLGQVDPAEAGERLSESVLARFAEALRSAKVPEAEIPGEIDAFTARWKRVNATDAARDLIDATILKPAIAAIDRDFGGQPLVDARLRSALAELYDRLGLVDTAMALATTSYERLLSAQGADDPLTLSARAGVAALLASDSRFDEAEQMLREVLDARRRVLGPDHPGTYAALTSLGTILIQRGRFGDAVPPLQQALEGRRRLLGPDDPETLVTLNNLAAALSRSGRLEDSQPLYLESFEARRRIHGEDDARTQTALGNLGVVLVQLGEIAEAEPYLRQSLASSVRRKGEAHPDTLVAYDNVGMLLLEQQKLDDAEAMFTRALDGARKVWGDDHPETTPVMRHMGMLLAEKGRWREAESILLELIERTKRLFGSDHHECVGAVLEYAGVMSNATAPRGESAGHGTHSAEDQTDDRGAPEASSEADAFATARGRQAKAREALALIEPYEPATRAIFKGSERMVLAAYLSGRARLRVVAATAIDESGGDPATVRAAYERAEAELLEAREAFGAANRSRRARQCTTGLVELYSAWERLEPGKGYAAKATEARGSAAAP